MPGRFHFVNYERHPSVEHLVHAEPLLLEYHSRCFATPLRQLPARRFTGCLYGNDGRIARLSQRPSSGAAYQPIDPEHLEVGAGSSDTQPAKTIYLGNMFNHFGHFILESLSRLWAVTQLREPFDAYYFHNWDGSAVDRLLNREHVITCFNAVGIPLDRVRIIPNSGLSLSNCLIPQQPFEVNRHVSALFNPVLTSIADYVRASSPDSRSQYGDCLYLSRLHQPRRAENEEAIERIFRDRGFVVIAPEKLPFRQQVAMVSGARILAGCAGSNMHLAAFASGATVISLDHRVVRNQLILEALRGHVAYHVWVRPEQISEIRWVADEPSIAAALEVVMSRALK
jgi:hypothetical protein